MEKQNKIGNNNPIKNLTDKLQQAYSKDKPKQKSIIKNNNMDSIEIENNEQIENLRHQKDENSENIMENVATVEEIAEFENKIQELSQKNEEISNKNAELEDMLKRRVAEFENFKRRTDKEKMELLEYGSTKLLSRFVDVLDDFKNAEQAANSTEDIASILKGFEMIHQKLIKLFNDEGVQLMETKIGDEFDVEKHEALMQQNSDLPAGCITMILQDGYIFKDKILRYAKVATSSGNE